MSNDIWVISDTHFSHGNICKFTNYDGTPLRPWDNVEDMNEAMIEGWNSVVKDGDKVYHLGDFSMGFKELPQHVVWRLKGQKRLVRGNHDMCPTAEYLKHFEDIYGVRVFHSEKLIFSHIPLHAESIKPGWLNVHGHLHNNIVRLPNKSPDTRYFNVSVERINYTPIHIDELVAMAAKLQPPYGPVTVEANGADF